MNSRFDVPALEGSLVRLEPLSVGHAKDLAVAAEEDRSTYSFTLVPRADEVGDYLAAQFSRVAQGFIPFAQIRRSDGRAVGCTAYWDPRYWPGRDETGLAATSFAPLRSALPGSLHPLRARVSTPRRTCC
jgi:N-acetyltransferase